jgi:SAM-dependent methyltransferase
MHKEDEAIYRDIQKNLPTIKPFLSELFYALPSLGKQKREMARQTLELLGNKNELNGYIEIGTTGRYISELRKHVKLTGTLILINDVPPSNSPVDMVERGQIKKLGRYVDLNHYAALSESEIPDNSIDLVTCYIGLHHIEPKQLNVFIRSLGRVLRKGGLLILRDHDVKTPEMFTFVSLAHTVFNAGLGISWEENAAEPRYFFSVDEWVNRLEALGFTDTGHRLLQAHDPSKNILMAFVKK